MPQVYHQRALLTALLLLIPSAAGAQPRPLGEAETQNEPADEEAAAAEEEAVVEEEAAAEETGAEEAGAEEAAAEDDPGEPEATEETGGDTVAEERPSAEEFAALQARLAALEEAQANAAVETLTHQEQESAQTDVLKIYGFMDMGVQRYWVDESSLIAAYLDVNALTFVMGNIDLYFDANPHPDWRALAEVRFSNAPRGRINNFGGIAGTFEREDTLQFDPSGAVANAPMWTGSIVIERAWIEWKRHELLRVRVGNFFTPFGIWNVDHGSPTLISAMLPQFIQRYFIPLRQTGVQALGSVFSEDLEFAYRAWVTNGREEINNLDFNDDKAVGARVFVRSESGGVQGQLGASYHHGRVADEVVDVISAPPLSDEIVVESYESFAYREDAIGVDLSLDIGATRIRTEALAHLRRYEEGKRPQTNITSPLPGSFRADSWRHSVYALVAHQLPFWGLEPYLYGELVRENHELPDGYTTFAPGFNVRFNPAAHLKVQVSRGWAFDWLKDTPGDARIYNFSAAVSRIVVAF